MAKILSIGPVSDVLASRNRVLSRLGHDVRGADTRSLALGLAASGGFEFIVICDQFLPAYAAELADELKAIAPATPVLILTQDNALSTDEIAGMIHSRNSQSNTRTGSRPSLRHGEDAA